MVKVEGLDHVGLAVHDTEKSASWYQEEPGLDRLYEDVRGNLWKHYS